MLPWTLPTTTFKTFELTDAERVALRDDLQERFEQHAQQREVGFGISSETEILRTVVWLESSFVGDIGGLRNLKDYCAMLLARNR